MTKVGDHAHETPEGGIRLRAGSSIFPAPSCRRTYNSRVPPEVPVSALPSSHPPLVLPGRFRAVVFDMDGLLLDTEPMWHDAERELLERHGDTFTEADMIASHGRALVDTAAVYGERLGLPAADIEQEIAEIMLAHYLTGAPLHAGARELIDALDGRLPMAVASNTAGILVRKALDAVGLGVLDVVASGMDIGSTKPAPDVYLEACRLLGVDPADAVAFEDSPMGVQAAKSAGMTAIGVPERPDVDLLDAGADLVLASLAQVVVSPGTGRVG
jgi:HAD superfamily hydrolase (TIGR01509 family)